MATVQESINVNVPLSHNTGVPWLVQALPSDAPVGFLEHDRGVVFPLDAGDAGLEMDSGVVNLPDGLDAAHEMREVLKLRPLVVDLRRRPN